MNNAKGVFLQLPTVILLSTTQKQVTRQKSSLFFLSQTIIPYFNILYRHLPFSCLAIIGYISVLLKKNIFWEDKIIVNTIDFRDNFTETNALFRYFTL